MAKFLRTPFLVFTEHLPPTASEIRTVSFLRIFFVSLDKSTSLHHRCLMSKFTEMLMLVCRKIFSAFYPTLHESFSNSYGFALLQEFIFYTGLVSSGASLTSWGEGASLALVGNPSSDGMTIKMPYGVDVFHRLA